MSLAQLAVVVSTATDVLRESNDEAERLAKVLQRHKHRHLEAQLKDYITDPKVYGFGGVSNLISVIAEICRGLAEELEVSDYEMAADKLEDVADAVDLTYRSQV